MIILLGTYLCYFPRSNRLSSRHGNVFPFSHWRKYLRCSSVLLFLLPSACLLFCSSQVIWRIVSILFMRVRRCRNSWIEQAEFLPELFGWYTTLVVKLRDRGRYQVLTRGVSWTPRNGALTRFRLTRTDCRLNLLRAMISCGIQYFYGLW